MSEGQNESVSPASLQALVDLLTKHVQAQLHTDSGANHVGEKILSDDIGAMRENDVTDDNDPETTLRVSAPSQPTNRKSLFGFSRSHQSKHRVSDSDDYENEYPPDAYGEEMGPNARIYKVYLDQTQKFDDQTADGMRDHLDVLLVFAGLFSAVVTTFVVESSSKLDVDWSEMNSHLLAESNAIQRALATGVSLNDVPVSPMSPGMDFVPKTADRWINGLWFSSLGFSLATALFAVLVKQWLRYFLSAIHGTARDRARVTQSRRDAFMRWRVITFVTILPTLLHISLFMFLVD